MINSIAHKSEGPYCLSRWETKQKKLFTDFFKLHSEYAAFDVAREIKIISSREEKEKIKLARLGVLYFALFEPESKAYFQLEEFGNYLSKQIFESSNQHWRYREKISPRFGFKIEEVVKAKFAALVFPKNGVFNPGGCFATLHYLKSHLAHLIANETHSQIAKVMHLLLKDKIFRKQLKQVIAPHISFKNTYYYSFGNTGSFYLRQDILRSLFAPVHQTVKGNCYAVAPAHLFLVNHTLFVLQLIQKIFQQGKFNYNDSLLPIAPLLDRLLEEESSLFNIKIKGKYASYIYGFQLASSLLDKKMDGTLKCETLSLGSLLRKTFGDLSLQASLIFLSSQKCLIQELLLSTFEFISINHLSHHFPLGGISERELFFHRFYDHFLQLIKLTYPDMGLQVDQQHVNQLLKKALFFIDFQETRSGLIKIRRLYFYKNGELIPLSSLPTYKNAIYKIFKNLQTYSQWEALLSKALQHESFGEQALSFFIKLPQMDMPYPELALQQVGSHATNLVWLYKKPPVAIIFSSENTLEWIEKTLEFTCSETITCEIKNLGHQVMAHYSGHYFNIYTFLLRRYFPKGFIDHQKIDASTKMRLQKKLSFEWQKQILMPFMDKACFELNFKEPMSWQHLKNKAVDLIAEEKINSFIKHFTLCFDLFKTCSFLRKIDLVIDSAKKKMNPNDLEIIKKLIIKNLSHKPWIVASDAVFAIQAAFRTLNYPLMHPFLLEQKICHLLNRPPKYRLGSLNWIGKEGMFPYHLAAGFCPFKEEYIFLKENNYLYSYFSQSKQLLRKTTLHIEDEN